MPEFPLSGVQCDSGCFYGASMTCKNVWFWVRQGAVRFSTCVSLLALAAVGSATAQQAVDVKPKVSDNWFTSDQLAVYRVVLASWYQGDKKAINLAIQTDPVNLGDDSFDKTCLKGLALEKTAEGEVHRFRVEDLAQLGNANFRLVDPESQAKEVRENDPGIAIREGKPVDDAVENGFAHGLLTLGEIQFDRSHTHALISFRFWCGMLCGHGTTMLLEKKGGVWTRKKQCGGWVS